VRSVAQTKAPQKNRGAKRAYAPGQLIVKFKPNVAVATAAAVKQQMNLKTQRRFSLTGAEVLSLAQGESVEDKASALMASGQVEYAEPNYVLYPSDFTPDDPYYSLEWGLHNSGQTILGQAGNAGVDINAPKAWDLTQGSSSLVVAVIDTGVDFNHPDLAGRAWVNAAEASGLPGVDDDGDGYVDDVNGYDFYNQDGSVFDPYDGDMHGTHVAGTIAADTNNALGVAGVAPNVKIMSLKFLGPNGGFTSDAVLAITYAKNHGVKLSNNSWEGPGSSSLSDAITNSGMVFVAAAGNDGVNIDSTPKYPAYYTAANMITVAAVGNTGALASFSNYGTTSVDVAAPGVSIASTYPKTAYGGGGAEVTGSNYKAVLWGFGLEEINDAIPAAGQRADAITRVGNFLGLTPATSSVLLVDDDESDVGYVDAGADYHSALTAAGYTNVTVQPVAYGSAGPDAATLGTYNAVIWVTGNAAGDPGAGIYPLQSTDIASLQTYLNNGGNLFLSGNDAMTGFRDTTQPEYASFFTNFLDANFVAEYGENQTVSGQTGTAFAGKTYTFSVYDPYRDVLEPAGGGKAVLSMEYNGDPDYSNAYVYLDGTSMATPHVTGVAALLMSVHPELSPTAVISRLKSTVKPLASLSGNVGTGGMVDAYNAVASSVTTPTISVSPLGGGANATYTMTFKPSNPLGALVGGTDTITVTFPAGTTVPASIPLSAIKVNNTAAGAAGSATVSGQQVTFTTPVAVASGATASVVFTTAAGILNPPSGTYNLSVVTSKDIVAVNSGNFTTTDATPPAAPTGLMATPGNTKVDLAWSANAEPDLAGYNLYRSTDNVNFTKINSSLLTTTTYSNTGLTNGSTYYYKLTAVDTSNNASAYSAVVSAKPMTVGISLSAAIFHGIGAEGGDRLKARITLNDPVSNTNSGVVDTVTATAKSTADATGISVTLTETGANTGVFTGKFGFTLDPSNDASDLLNVAGGNTVTVTASTYSATATWQAANAMQYQVQGDLGLGGQALSTVTARLLSDTGTVLDTRTGAGSGTTSGLTDNGNGTAHFFFNRSTAGTFSMQAYKTGYYVGSSTATVSSTAGGYDSVVTTVSGSTYTDQYQRVIAGLALVADSTPPASPTGFSAAGTDRAASLTWTANSEPDLAGYNVWYRTGVASFTKANSSLLTATTYTLSSLVNGTTYDVQVEAVDLAGNKSAVASTTVVPHDNVAPALPTNLAATKSNGAAALTWTAPADADKAGYNVYRSTDNATYTKINGALVTATTYADSGLTNGTLYYYKVTSVDTSANESAMTAAVSVMPSDGVAPSGGAVSINAGTSYTNSTAVTLTITVPGTSTEMQVSSSSAFTGATWEPAAASKSFTLAAGDGLKTVYVRFRDADQDVGTAVSDTITLDTAAPAAGTVKINAGAASTNNTAVTLTITIPTGGAEMQVSEAADFSGATWEPAATTKSFTLTVGDGTKTVYVRFRDAALNAGASANDIITLDTTPPVGGSVVIAGGAGYTKTTAVTLTITAPADATQMQISADPTFTGATWVAKAGTASFALSTGDGPKAVYVRFRDALNNEQSAGSAASDGIVLDTTAPTGSISIDSGATVTTSATRSVAVSVTATDANLGVEVKLSESPTFVGATYVPTGAPIPSFTLSAGDGLKTIYARFRDAAGNESTTEIKDTIILDLAAPTVTGVTSLSTTALNIQFSEDMDPATIIDANFTVTKHSDASAVIGTVTYDATGRKAIFTAAVQYGTQYDVTVSTGVTDLAGTPLASAYSGTVTPTTPVFGGGGGGASTGDVTIDVDDPTGDVTAIVNDTTDGNRDIAVTIPDAGDSSSEDTTVKYLEVPASVLDKLADHDRGLTVDTSWATLQIPADALTELPGYAGAEKVTVTVQLVDPSSQSVKGSLDNAGTGMNQSGRVLEFSLKLGASNTEHFSTGITVTIPYTSASNPSHLGVYRLDSTTGQWEYRGGKVDTANQTVTFITHGFSTYTLFEFNKQFTDMTGHWAQDDVELMAARHVANGTGNGITFDPNGQVTRAQFAALLVRTLGLEETPGSTPFTDVDGKAWYTGAVRTAARQGLVQGSNGLFRPNDLVTRQEMALMLQRALSKAGKTITLSTSEVEAAIAAFSDGGSVDAWARDGAALAVSQQWIRGRDGNQFAPKDPATRAEAVVILKRLLTTLGAV